MWMDMGNFDFNNRRLSNIYTLRVKNDAPLLRINRELTTSTTLPGFCDLWLWLWLWVAGANTLYENIHCASHTVPSPRRLRFGGRQESDIRIRIHPHPRSKHHAVSPTPSYMPDAQSHVTIAAVFSFFALRPPPSAPSNT